MVEDGVVAYERAGSWPDLKFVGATWLDFFDEYIVPGIADRMVFDTQILRIEHGGDEVVLTDANNTVWVADRIVFTAPMKDLQDGDIEFEPGLPPSHTDPHARADIWTGMKVFVEFSEQFWPVWLNAKPDRGGQHLWYDASYGQHPDSARVLGLFTVGAMSAPYQAVDPGDELRDLVLAELDPLFDGIPSRTYVQHISQNWADEPFVRAAYLADTADSDISQDLGKTSAHGSSWRAAATRASTTGVPCTRLSGPLATVLTRCTPSAGPQREEPNGDQRQPRIRSSTEVTVTPSTSTS